MINKLDKQYTDLLQDILDNGVKKETRNGGTLSVFGRQIRHKMSEGFPLITTKKMPFRLIATELLWFLRGDTNIKYLVDNNCHIWDGDAYQAYLKQFEVDPNNFNVDELVNGHGDQCWGYPILDHVKPTSKEYKRGQINAYLEGKADKPFFYLTQEEFINKIKTDNEFAKEFGELGPIYGEQWRKWGGYFSEGHAKKDGTLGVEFPGIDQIQTLISDLKTNPDSRRLMVNAWNVGELDQMVLPPCHNFWQMYSVKKEDKRYLSMMVNIRSNDVPLGLPFNIASYGLLLEIISRLVNMIPDELIINIGDAHIYLNQIEGIKEQLTRESYPLPKLIFNNQIHFSDNIDEFLNSCLITDFTIENYQFHPTIKLPLSN